MARTFGGVSTDKVNIGRGAPYDNILSSGNGLSWVGTSMRTGTGNNQYHISKASATTGGWEIIQSFRPPGTEPGHLRFIAWTNANRYDVSAGSADGVAVTAANTQYIHCLTFTGTTVAMYQATMDGKLTVVPSYTTTVSGSGTLGADSAADLYIGNVVRGGPFPFSGTIGFNLLWSRSSGGVLSATEREKAQMGIQWYLAGLEQISRGGSETTLGNANIARAVALWRSISGYVLLSYTYTNGSGNCETIDYVASSSGTVIGTPTGTTSGSDSSGWHAPASGRFQDDLETTLGDQTYYAYTSEFAKWGATTSATSFAAFMQGTLDPATYPNQAVLGYELDGVWTGKLSASALGLNVVSVSGLSASSKVISFLNGARSHPNGVPAPYQGTFLTAVRFGASATEVVPPTRTKPCLVFGDSVGGDYFYADSPQRYGAFQTLRRNLPAWLDSVAHWGAGGQALYDYFGDSTKRADLVARVQAMGTPAALVFWLGYNDMGRDYWSSATAKTAIVTGVNDLLAAFSGQIYFFSPTPFTSGVEANTSPTYGETVAAWRTMLSTVSAASNTPSRVTFVDTKTVPWLDVSTQLNADGLHPNTSGHQSLGTQTATIMAGNPIPFTVTASSAAGLSTVLPTIVAIRAGSAITAGQSTVSVVLSAIAAGTTATRGKFGAQHDRALAMLGGATGFGAQWAQGKKMIRENGQ